MTSTSPILMFAGTTPANAKVANRKPMAKAAAVTTPFAFVRQPSSTAYTSALTAPNADRARRYHCSCTATWFPGSDARGAGCVVMIAPLPRISPRTVRKSAERPAEIRVPKIVCEVLCPLR